MSIFIKRSRTESNHQLLQNSTEHPNSRTQSDNHLLSQPMGRRGQSNENVIIETNGEEDLELLSKQHSAAGKKKTMIEQNPHFKRSIIMQSLLKPTNEVQNYLIGSVHQNAMASNDQDRANQSGSHPQQQIEGIQTLLMTSQEQTQNDISASSPVAVRQQDSLMGYPNSPGMNRLMQMSKIEEMRNMQLAVEENNLQKFLAFNLTKIEILTMRFNHSLNIMQAACYFGAERIIKYLKEVFKDDEQGKYDLVEYQEPNGGNMAIHFAVLKGNKRIIDSLLQDFNADPTAFTLNILNFILILHFKLTSNGLCVLHCAAQFERGALSLEYFHQFKFGFNYDFRDKFKCTPLHFAVLNMQAKCVECLLALGADPNSQNSDNQTPLHIAVQKYIQQSLDALDEGREPDPSEFEEVKRVIKELLFNGGDRSCEGRFNLKLLDHSKSSEFVILTPMQLLMSFQDKLPEREFVSLYRILNLQRQMLCFQTRRPLEKVTRDNRFMIAILVFNLVNFAVFLLYYSPFYFSNSDFSTLEKAFYSMGLVGVGFFFISMIFYLMSNCMDPGYVHQSLDMVDLLQIGNDRNIDLENFCFYCKVIKSTCTFHCMICNKCVEKFDHHCVYINNCLGHRNHKYFILFLFCISLYILTSVSTCVGSFITHGGDRGEEAFEILDWFFRVYTILINLLQSIPLLYQLKEQTKKLAKVEKIERKGTNASTLNPGRPRAESKFNKLKDASSRASSQNNQSQKELMKESLITGTSMKSSSNERRGCRYNCRQLFCFQSASQDTLKVFLFSDSERYSTFLQKEEKRKKKQMIKQKLGQTISLDKKMTAHFNQNGVEGNSLLKAEQNILSPNQKQEKVGTQSSSATHAKSVQRDSSVDGSYVEQQNQVVYR